MPRPGGSAASAVPPTPGFKTRLRIALVCDFFFPRFGGVENHVWSLAQALVRLGHKAVVVTHAYDNRVGVRWMAGGVKVYYAPFASLHDQASAPSIVGTLPLMRDIFLRERIDIVHGHQITAALAPEALMHARAMGLRTVRARSGRRRRRC